MVLKIEEATVGQRSCKDWHRLRKCRIGASHAGWVLNCFRRKTCPPSLMKTLRGEYDFSQITAVNWGVKNEAMAIEACEKDKNIKIKPSGAWVSDQYSFLIASPDGIIEPGFLNIDRCTVHEGGGRVNEISGKQAKGILEIKCLYKFRNASIAEAIDGSGAGFHLNKDGLLNTWHNYYAQIQLGMHFSRSAYCLFVTHTNAETKYEVVYYNETWIRENLHKLVDFYNDVFIPNL